MLIYFLIALAAEANVIGIDLGSELVKISVIKPGKKLVIVENEQSQRSTPLVFSLTQTSREFGFTALQLQTKHTDSTVSVIKQLLGRPIGDPIINQTLARSYQGHTIAASQFQSVSYILNTHELEIELIAGMLFRYFKEISDKFASSNIKDCVVSVPSTFNRPQKLALMNSLEISELEILSLINDNSAAALYYSLDRIDSDTDHLAVIYNVGSNYMQVSVVSFWGYYENSKYHSFVDVLGHQSDESFGGALLDYEMAEIIIKDFSSEYESPLKIDKKSLARLMREVNRAKKTLSANKSVRILLENFYNGTHISFEFTRERLNSLILAHKDQLISPLKALLTKLNIDEADIKSLELIGGVSRIPYIQELLESSFNMKPMTHIDPNEAIAHGAALFAAQQSATITLKPITLTDVSSCSITGRTSTSEFTIFPEFSKLNSSVSLSFSLTPEDYLLLTEVCNSSQLPFYNYTFTSSGLITLRFFLDSNGLARLSEATPDTSFTQTELSPLSSTFFTSLTSKISEYLTQESKAQRILDAKTQIESIVYYIKEKIEDETFIRVTKEDELKLFKDYIEGAIEWIESNEFTDAGVEEIRQKIEEIRQRVVDAVDREQEFKVRDRMVTDAKGYFSKLNEFMKMVEETATWIDKEEIEDAWNLLKDTEKWFEERVEAQKALEDWEPPILKAAEFDQRYKKLTKKLEKLAYAKPGQKKNKK